MKHYCIEEIDAFLDGRRNPLRRWWTARHIARCAQCRALLESCEADRALLDELRRGAREHDAVARALPATRVVAPSVFSRGDAEARRGCR